MATITGTIGRLWRDQQGQGLSEYALLLGLISLVVVTALRALGSRLAGFFQDLLALFP